jgi:2'-5' RNA ligase
MGAEVLDLEAAGAALEGFASAAQPFSVYATGLGIFTGARPVVYVPLAKNAALLEMHAQLWDRMSPAAQQINGYYTPARWMPHITLAFREFDPDRLACAVEDISFQNIAFRVQVDHFAIIYANNGEAGVTRVFPFRCPPESQP